MDREKQLECFISKIKAIGYIETCICRLTYLIFPLYYGFNFICTNYFFPRNDFELPSKTFWFSFFLSGMLPLLLLLLIITILLQIKKIIFKKLYNNYGFFIKNTTVWMSMRMKQELRIVNSLDLLESLLFYMMFLCYPVTGLLAAELFYPRRLNSDPRYLLGFILLPGIVPALFMYLGSSFVYIWKNKIMQSLKLQKYILLKEKTN